ncbi:class I SAM-dependent methyltransferase, partial [Brachyspira pilosicoli]
MKETILDVFLRKYRINMVKSTIIKYNDCKLLDIGCGWEARFLKSIENYISYGVGVDFKPPELKTDKLETIKLTLENKLP